ncbi:hypothetical protein D9757_009372 [Collybiopsis confluens]|uniref:Uncharacterized protein n=1 Tax=Collybiopsis confluens TaxID=2823264 RepID=A0A8H5H6S5_9AGAR|nr:hypothetical protein D9757_009372 [Collybiopsis confluens]
MPDSESTTFPMTSTSSGSGPSSVNKEQEKGYSVVSRGRRPSSPARQPSYTRRHASIDSPREIPLPSPSPHVQGNQIEYSYFDVPLKAPKSPKKLTHFSKEKEKDVFSPVFEEDLEGGEWTAVDKLPVPNLSLQTKSQTQGILTPPYTGSSSHLYETHSPLGLLASNSQQIHPYPRPYSLPHHSSSSSGSGGSTVGPGSSTPSSDEEIPNVPRLARHRTDEGKSISADIYNSDFGFGKGNREVDRSSSASLPLPSQIPFHTLPRVGHPHHSDVGRLRELVSEVARSEMLESAVEEVDEVNLNVSSTTANSSTLPSTSPSLRKSFKSSATPPPVSRGNTSTTSNSHATSSPHTSAAGPATWSMKLSTNDSPSQHLNAILEATAYATALRRRPLSSQSSDSSTLPPPEPPVIHPPPNPTYEPSLEKTSHNPPSEILAQPPPVPPPITNPSELPPVLPPSRMRRSVPNDILSDSAGSTPNPAFSSPSGSSRGPYSGSSGLSSSGSSPGPSGQAVTQGESTNPSNAPPPYAPFLSHMPPQLILG